MSGMLDPLAEFSNRLTEDFPSLSPEDRITCIMLLAIVRELRAIRLQVMRTADLYEFELGIDVEPEPEEEKAGIP